MSAQLSQHDLQDLGQLIAGDATHFSAHLVRLIKRADSENRQLLARVFPIHVQAVDLWESSGGKPMWLCPACFTINTIPSSSIEGGCRSCGRGVSHPLPGRRT
jgi:hypothetical protein